MSCDRPASILTWKLSLKVQALLAGLACGDIPLTHQGLDDAGKDNETAHLRSLLEHNGILPARDEPLARFERWLTLKLDAITEPAVRTPVEQFATWYHLRRLRKASTPGQRSDAATRYAKQDITEAIKFLAWLHNAHQRTVATCLQQDVNEWLISGPTTRSKIRNFFAWAKKARLNTSVQIARQQPPPSRAITQEQRLAWLKELLSGEPDSLAYRVAGVLLLLYAQPLTKIAALPIDAVSSTDGETRNLLGQQPIPVPQPFAGLLNTHLRNRPNLRTTGGLAATQAVPQQPARPTPRPTIHHETVAQPRHQPPRGTQHRAAEPGRRSPTTPRRGAPRLQPQRHPAPRRDRSTTMGCLSHVAQAAAAQQTAHVPA